MFRVFMRFTRYQVIGLLGFILDLAVLYVLINVAHVQYLLATVIGFACAVVFSFFINRVWTYKKWIPTGRGIVLSLIVGATSLMIVILVTYLGVGYAGAPYFPVRIGAAGLSAVWGYIFESWLTFRIAPFDNYVSGLFKRRPESM